MLNIEVNMPLKDNFDQQRKSMIDKQIRPRGITQDRILNAMAAVPRHAYVPSQSQSIAYEDYPVSLPHAQSISQPYIVALMSETLNPQFEEAVLEIGTGSGYQTAILSLLCKQVYSMEIIPALSLQAQKINCALGYTNISYLIGDGSLGWPGSLTFDAILVTAGAPVVPQALLAQLKRRGRMVIPVGTRPQQMLEVWSHKDKEFSVQSILPVAFVPLVGRQGWQ